MQLESIAKLEKLYALIVGQHVRDKYVRHIHRWGPFKLRSQSSLRGHYEIWMCFLITKLVGMLFSQRPIYLLCLPVVSTLWKWSKHCTRSNSKDPNLRQQRFIFMCLLLFLPRDWHLCTLCVVAKRNSILSINANNCLKLGHSSV